MEVLQKGGTEANFPRISHNFAIAEVYNLMEAHRDERQELYDSLTYIPGEPQDVTVAIVQGFKAALREQDIACREEAIGRYDATYISSMHRKAETYALLAMQLGNNNIAALSPFDDERQRYAEVSPLWLKQELIERFDSGRLTDRSSPYCRPAVERFVEVSSSRLQQIETRPLGVSMVERMRGVLPDKRTLLGATSATLAGIILTPTSSAAVEMTPVVDTSRTQYMAFEGSYNALPGLTASPEPIAPSTSSSVEELPSNDDDEVVDSPNVLPGLTPSPEPEISTITPDEEVEINPAQTPITPNVLPGLTPSPEPYPNHPHVEPIEQELPKPAPAPVPAPAPAPPEKPKQPEKKAEKGVEARIVAGYSIDKFAGYDQCLGEWGGSPTAGGNFCSVGCGPTSTAEVVHVLRGGNTTPGDMIPLVNQYGGFGSFGTSYDTNTSIANHFGIRTESLQGGQGAPIRPSYDQIRNVLEQGGLVVVAGAGVDPYVPTGQAGAHFMIIRAITDDGNFLLYNPYTRHEGSWESDPSDRMNKTIYKADHIINNSFGAMFFYK